MTTATDILKARILIVDDQPVNVQLLEQLLSQAGYTSVSSTTEPTEVCMLHEADPYDLILLDLKMPGMDGFQVMQGLKASVRLTTANDYLPVIVLTAEPAHKLRALQLGARDFITKPFDLVEVKTRIHNMLEVRILYKTIEEHNVLLKQTVRERTARLILSDDLVSTLQKPVYDWYWEQCETGQFTTVSGPILDILGLRVTAFFGAQSDEEISGWNAFEKKGLQEKIAARQPFRNFEFSRNNSDGSRQQFRVSGEPLFNGAANFIGFRGVGVEISQKTTSLEATGPAQHINQWPHTDRPAQPQKPLAN